MCGFSMLFDQPVRGFQGNLRSHLLLVGTLFRKGNQLKGTLKNWSRGFRVFSQTVASQFPDSEIHVSGHKCAYCSIQVCVGFCCNRIFSYLWPRTKFCEKQEAKTSIAIYRWQKHVFNGHHEETRIFVQIDSCFQKSIQKLLCFSHYRWL